MQVIDILKKLYEAMKTKVSINASRWMRRLSRSKPERRLVGFAAAREARGENAGNHYTKGALHSSENNNTIE